jgi:hypothetical protein
MNYDLSIIERQVYSVSDWLESVGGFMGSVEFIFLILVPLVNVRSLEKHLVYTLFYRYQENQD